MNESRGNNLKGRNKTQKRSSVIAYRWNHFDVIEVNGKKSMSNRVQVIEGNHEMGKVLMKEFKSSVRRNKSIYEL